MKKHRFRFLCTAFCVLAATMLSLSVAVQTEASDCCNDARRLISVRFDELEEKWLSGERTDAFLDEYSSAACTLRLLQASVLDLGNPHRLNQERIIREMLMRHIFFDLGEDLARLEREVRRLLCGGRGDKALPGPSLPVPEPASARMAKDHFFALVDLRTLLQDPLVVYAVPAPVVFPLRLNQYFWDFFGARRRISLRKNLEYTVKAFREDLEIQYMTTYGYAP